MFFFINLIMNTDNIGLKCNEKAVKSLEIVNISKINVNIRLEILNLY